MTAPLVPKELLDPVVAYFAPRRVIVFGSVARGEAGADIDLIVIVDDDTPPEKLTGKCIAEARRGYHDPADVIAVRESVFERKSWIAGTLAYEARAYCICRTQFSDI